MMFMCIHSRQSYELSTSSLLMPFGPCPVMQLAPRRLACLAMGTLMLEPDLPGSSLPVTSSKKVKVLRQVVCNGSLPSRFLVQNIGMDRDSSINTGARPSVDQMLESPTLSQSTSFKADGGYILIYFDMWVTTCFSTRRVSYQNMLHFKLLWIG